LVVSQWLSVNFMIRGKMLAILPPFLPVGGREGGKKEHSAMEYYKIYLIVLEWNETTFWLFVFKNNFFKNRSKKYHIPFMFYCDDLKKKMFKILPFSPHFRIWFPLSCLLSPFVIILWVSIKSLQWQTRLLLQQE